jgi:hypothetical protein
MTTILRRLATFFLALGLAFTAFPASAQSTLDAASPAAAPGPATAAPPPAPPPPGGTEYGYTTDELVTRGHGFFGEVSEGLASVVEQAVAQYGLPNGYILGEEGSGAIIGGLRYGEGVLYTKNAGQHRVFWQGPSVGLDVGGSGDRVMMLVYNLPSIDAIYQRYLGVAGSAHIVAGFGMTALARDNTYVVPIISGVGARLGVNFGYLKFTQTATWNPF